MKTTLHLILILSSLSLIAQQDPFFMPFEGPVYKLPAKAVMNAKFGYSEEIYNYEQIAEVSLQELKIPSTHTNVPFPGVDRKDRYGMVLKSEMVIKQDGCYVFDLFSDDGSVFWINEQKIIDNDHTHKYTHRTDTVFVKKGKYPITIWYYQGFIHKYGLTFDARYIGEECPEATTLGPGKPLLNKINLSSQVLFDYDSVELKAEAVTALDSVISKIPLDSVKSITVIGHTCSDGKESYNQKLSQRRADCIRDYFLNNLKKPGVIFRSKGKGAQLPIVPNDTEANKSKNRRVEIIIE